MVSDTDLVARLRAGQPAAFDLAWGRYRPALYGFLVRMSKRRDVAEELLQETFLRLARHAPRLREDTNLRAYLFTIARNLAISHQRWAWLDGERLLELAAAAMPWSVPPSPYETAVAEEATRRIEAAISALSASYREVVLLVMVEHMEPREAASVLGISPEAVRQRLTRARQILAPALEEPRGVAHGRT